MMRRIERNLLARLGMSEAQARTLGRIVTGESIQRDGMAAAALLRKGWVVMANYGYALTEAGRAALEQAAAFNQTGGPTP